MRPRISSFMVLASAVGIAACPGKQPPPATPAPTTTTQPTMSTPLPPPPVVPITSTQPPGRTAAEIAAEAIAKIKNTLGETIFFEYDKADLTSAAQATLDSKVPLLQRFANVRIQIAGHTDERGSDSYNVALGQRRAAAAQRYLESRGIAPTRFDVVSYGEERPAIGGEGEMSWSRNRRDEFVIVAGADQIRPAN